MPTQYTVEQNLPYPEPAMPADIALYLQNIAEAVNKRLITVCTSATRPTGSKAYAGHVIYETDTKAFGLYNGTAWIMWDTQWQTYTPTWSSSGTQPTVGNGSIAGKYLRMGRECSVHIALITGSTTTYGTGQYYFSSPFTHQGVHTSIPTVGTAWCLNQGGYHLTGIVNIQTATAVSVFLPTSTTNFAQVQWSATTPWTFKNTDQMSVNYRVPLA